MKTTVKPIFAVLLILSPFFALAENLCGTTDETACLANSTVFDIYVGGSVFYSGSQLILAVPGIEFEPGSQLFGHATEPYWFDEPNGWLQDSLGNTWSAPVVSQMDDRGGRALTFELISGTLTGHFKLYFEQISVCQFIADGPRNVYLNFQMSLVTHAGKSLTSLKGTTSQGLFQFCTDFKGYLPATSPGDKVFISNPRNEGVMVSIDQEMMLLGPYEQLEIEGGSLTEIASSSEIGIVLRAEKSDLNLVTVLPKDNEAYLIPHLSNQPATWTNMWKTAISERTQMQYKIADEEVKYQTLTPGLWEIPIEVTSTQPNAWARLNTISPSNGYFNFTRIDGIPGGAAINALRLTKKPFGFSSLYLTHVAADTDHFWTGFALVNPNDEVSTVTVRGFSSSGSEVAMTEVTLQPSEKITATLGTDFFNDVEDISWIQFDSTIPIAGIELFGGQAENQPYLAGFLMEHAPSGNLAFAYLDTTPSWWSGIALLNPGSEPALGSLIFLDSQGIVVEQVDVEISSQQKTTFLAPEGATQAVWTGNPLLGFALVGDDARTRLGGYLGTAITP